MKRLSPAGDTRGRQSLAIVRQDGALIAATFGAIVYGYATTGEIPATMAPADLENLARPASSPR